MFSPSGAFLAITDPNRSTHLWVVAARKITAILSDSHSRSALSAVFSPNGAMLATADFNGSTHLEGVRYHSSPATLKAGRSIQLPGPTESLRRCRCSAIWFIRYTKLWRSNWRWEPSTRTQSWKTMRVFA